MPFSLEFDERQTAASLASMGMIRAALPFPLAGASQEFLDLLMVVGCQQGKLTAAAPAFSVLEMNFFAPAGAAEELRFMRQLPAACGFTNAKDCLSVEGRAELWLGVFKWMSGQPAALVVPFSATVSVEAFVLYVVKLAPPKTTDDAIIQHILNGVQLLADAGTLKDGDGSGLPPDDNYESIFALIWVDTVSKVLKGPEWEPARELASIDAAKLIVGAFREIPDFKTACPQLVVPASKVLNFKDKSQKNFRWAVTRLMTNQIAPGIRLVAGMEPVTSKAAVAGAAPAGGADMASAMVAGIRSIRAAPSQSDKEKHKTGAKIDPAAFVFTIEHADVVSFFSTVSPAEKADPAKMLTKFQMNSDILKFLIGSQVEQVDSPIGRLIFAARLFLEECVKSVVKEYIHDRDSGEKGSKWIKGILLLSVEAITGDLSLMLGGIHVRRANYAPRPPSCVCRIA